MPFRTITEILAASEKAFNDLDQTCAQMPEGIFFREWPGKWSIAQHLQHLIISTKTSTAAYALPRWIVRLVGGRAQRPSETYTSLVARYQHVLESGGKASGRYVPGHIAASVGRLRMLGQWQNATKTYLHALESRWSDEQLDRYVAPHPLLGKITLRELAFFNIYHSNHHLQIIQARLEDDSSLS